MSAVEIGELIESGWPLSGVKVGTNRRGFGSFGVYPIESKQGKFIVKMVDAPSAKVMAASLHIFDFLHTQNVTFAPELLRCRDGAAFQQWASGFAYIYGFVPGETPEPTPENYAKLGAVIGHLHGLQGYQHPSRWTTRDVIGHIIYDRAPQLPYQLEYLEIARQLRDLDGLPQCLIHGDVALINAIQKPDSDLVLIDWGGWLGPRVLDAAKVLLQFLDGLLCFNERSARAFYQAYFALQSITEEEMAYFFDAALLMPMNFVICGPPLENWTRIQWACQNRRRLLHLVGECWKR